MTWYNDPEPSGGPPDFGAQPTGMPTNPNPQMGGGDLPTTPANGSNKPVLWIVSGVGALMTNLTDSDVGAELNEELADADSDCSLD